MNIEEKLASLIILVQSHGTGTSEYVTKWQEIVTEFERLQDVEAKYKQYLKSLQGDGWYVTSEL